MTRFFHIFPKCCFMNSKDPHSIISQPWPILLFFLQGAATNFLVMCGFLAFSFVVRHVLNSTALVDGDEWIRWLMLLLIRDVQWKTCEKQWQWLRWYKQSHARNHEFWDYCFGMDVILWKTIKVCAFKYCDEPHYDTHGSVRFQQVKFKILTF